MVYYARLLLSARIEWFWELKWAYVGTMEGSKSFFIVFLLLMISKTETYETYLSFNVALPFPEILKAPKGLEHVGPRECGYDVDFRSVFE